MGLTTNYEICEAMARVLAADNDVVFFCQKNFEVKPKFFVGIDREDPPKLSDAPFVAIMPLPESGDGDLEPYKMHSIFVGCCMKDDRKSTVDNIVTFKGFEVIGEFERLVYKALDAFFAASVNGENDAAVSISEPGDGFLVAYHPEFHSRRQMKIISERTI